MKLSTLLISALVLLTLVISSEPYQSLPHAEAAIFVVNSLADTNDGTCNPANCTLREAIATANGAGGADVINFDAAIAGGTITLSSQLDVTGDLTINGSSITLDGNNATRIMEISPFPTVTLDDLTFQNGSAANATNDLGGAINNFGILTITNSTFSGNSAGVGGAINNVDTLTLTNSTFSSNSADLGGAITNTGSGTATLTNSTFSDNLAVDTGGAILNGGMATITGSTFSDNSADGNGGAIINAIDSTLTITGSTFSDNSADGNGGAIINAIDSTLTITNSTFSGNQAIGGGIGLGGAISNNGGTANITSSTFSSNTAATTGGSISNFGTLAITSSTFSSNTASLGGGAIFNYDETANITNSTFSGNAAKGDGGAILNASDATATITSSTFNGNTAANGGSLHRDNGTLTVTSSIIAGGNCSGTITDQGHNLNFNATGCPGTVADPQLGPLQNNGGPTDTMLPALNSAAVDAYAAPCATATDQRGITRPQGPLCDIGATEQDGSIDLAASAVCNGPNLDVTISAGDGPFNITASAGVNTPVNGVNTGTTTINGPEKWDDLTVTETTGNTQSVNLGQFKCRSTERPVPVSPAHQSHTTSAFPLFSWTGISVANNYRMFVFDDANPATRTVDIRENSGGPTNMQLSTPLPNGRLFWRVRGRQNRIWSLWSIRFTLFKDPPPPLTVNTPVPTIDLNPPAVNDSVPNIPAPPNSR